MNPSCVSVPIPLVIAEAQIDDGSFHAALAHIQKGLSQSPVSDAYRLGLHFGKAVKADCLIGGVRATGWQRAGDIGFIPPGADGKWEDDRDCQILRLSLSPTRLATIAEKVGKCVDRIDFTPRPRMNDARIKGVGDAIRAHLVADEPSDPLYLDFLADALSVRLIEMFSTPADPSNIQRSGQFSDRELRRLTDHIMENLDSRLALADLSNVAGVSATTLKERFRATIGMPIHQYIIKKRVEYARELILETKTPLVEIALAAGFSHQSHMANAMRRILGQTPGQIARSGGSRPNMQRYGCF